jgi:cysteine-S-conjugate beta-lyase
MKIEGLPLKELRQRKSTKWRTFAPEILPLPVAEMDFEIAKPIRNLLIKTLERSDTGYLGPIPELSTNIEKFARKRWGWKLDPDQIFPATDVGVGMVEFARTFLNPGDQIMLNTPVYHNILNWINELKANPYDAPLAKNGMNYSLDFTAIEAGYQSGVRAHFLCNPHNPVGIVFTKDELSRLADLAKKYDVTIFSDEIHGPLVYSPNQYVPFLAVSETAREVGVCVTSASKTWNLAGLKCAMIITQSEKQLERAKSMPMAVHYRASLFGALAAAEAFACTKWLDATLKTLDRNRKFLKAELDRKLPQVGYRMPDCTYLAWLDLGALNLGDNPAEVLLAKGKVAVKAGIDFGPSSSQFVRFNFATSEKIISAGVDRMVKALK